MATRMRIPRYRYPFSLDFASATVSSASIRSQLGGNGSGRKDSRLHKEEYVNASLSKFVKARHAVVLVFFLLAGVLQLKQ